MQVRRYFRYHYLKMLRLKDAPAKVAQGFALGLAMDFIVPIPFVSIFIAFLVARLIRFNSLAAVMAATAFKPLFAGIVTLNYTVSKQLVHFFPGLSIVSMHVPRGSSPFHRGLGHVVKLGFPYLTAGMLNGVIIGLISYLVVYYFLRERQIKRLKKLKKTCEN